MRVSFSIGPKSPQIINTLSKSADNVEFMSYGSIQEMIKESVMRHLFFDRIIFSEKIINDVEKDLQDLNDYIVQYSDSTSIVFMCQGSSNSDEVFNKIFNSPLYTPVILQKATSTILLEFVQDSIVSLKTKYYTLDVQQAKGVTSKRELPKEVENQKEVVAEEPVKKGLFKGLFGGKKNKHSKNENGNPNLDSVSSIEKTSENLSKNIVENVVSSTADELGNTSFSGSNTSSPDSDVNSFYSSYETSPALDRSDEFNNQISSDDLDFSNLGLGDLGEQHFDTGFLDENIEEEIDRELEEESINSELGDDEFDSSEEELEQDTSYASEEHFNDESNIEVIKPSNSTKYRLVLGERNSGVSTYIADNSVKYVSKGLKVLVIDLDYKHNGILSFVDTSEFYNGNHNNGIENLNYFSDDGIDILSNGYGSCISKESLDRLVSSSFLDNYDVVFVDCPLDCLNVLTNSFIEDFIGMIKVNGNKGSISNTLVLLTDRGNIDKDIEDMLYEKCKFDITNKIEWYDEDIKYLKDNCIFSRNNWLNKII